jgi:hypothetical protein
LPGKDGAGVAAAHGEGLVDAGLLARDKRGVWAYDRLVPGALDALSAALAGGRLIELEGSLARTSPAIWSCDGGRFQPRLDPQVMERCSSNHALSRCGAGRYVPASPAGGRLGHQATEADRTGIRWAASPATSSAFACG